MISKLMDLIKIPIKQLIAWYHHSSHPFGVQLRNNIIPFLYDFLVTGPALIGFIVPLWREEPGNERFLLACQSLLVFISYLLVLLITRLIYLLGDWFFLAPWVDSTLATIYLLVTGFLLYRLRHQQPWLWSGVRTWWEKYLA